MRCLQCGKELHRAESGAILDENNNETCPAIEISNRKEPKNESL